MCVRERERYTERERERERERDEEEEEEEEEEERGANKCLGTKPVCGTDKRVAPPRVNHQYTSSK